MVRKLLFGLLTLTLVLAACAPAAEPASSGMTFTDGLGRAVTLSGPAQKIVSMAPSNTEILFAIGAGSAGGRARRILGLPGRGQSPCRPSAARWGSTAMSRSPRSSPTSSWRAASTRPSRSRRWRTWGSTVFYLGNPSTLEEMYANLELVAQLTGRETEAAALVESLKTRVKAVDEKLAPLSY